MLRWATFPASIRLGRLVHLITAVFVFSYIAFDVLDLDLSDFPLKQAARERAVVVTEVPKGTEWTNLIDHDGHRLGPWLFDASVVKQSMRLHDNNIQRTSQSHSARTYVHRLVFPRSSRSDSPPAA